MSDESWNVILDHCLAAIPSELTARRRLLSALVAVVPTDVPRQREMAISLGHLDSHLIAQRELCLEIGIGPAPLNQPARCSARLGDSTLGRSNSSAARAARGAR